MAVNMEMLGSSNRFKTILRAGAAHSSPRRYAGSVLIWGCVENRAATAQTARMITGAKVPALKVSARNRLSYRGLQHGGHLLELSHVRWLVHQVIRLSVHKVEENFREMLLNLF